MSINLEVPNNAEAINNVPSVGIFPKSFPRDPIEVNSYLEHMLLGQIIEPLVECGVDGSVTPSVAERWVVEKGGKEIHFYIRKNLKFSNGMALTSEDVKYSLERHKNNSRSQSGEYFKRIKSISTGGPYEVSIELYNPYVAIFKALSRDHLGIVPKGWAMNKNSNEPIIGSGAYRAIKYEENWQLQKNYFYRNASEVEIKTWNVILGDLEKDSITVAPDVMPFGFSSQVTALKARNPNLWSKLKEVELTQFFQSSAWWYPHGPTFQNTARKSLAMSSMQSLFEKVAEKNNLKLATGLIPDGIPGSLRNRPKLVSLDTAAIQDRSFNIAVLAREFRYINDKNLIDAVDKEFRVKINVFSVESKDISDLPKKRPDVFILGLAGSFYDPEGFLDLLSSCLAADAKSIFAENYDLYKTAGNESDWNTRAPIYQDLSQKIQTNFTMVPGWKIAAVRLMNPQLEFDQNDLRYTPKLKDYRFRKEDQ